MFLVNSRYPQFCATGSGSTCKRLHLISVILLPKLRMHFAEFLRHGSLNALVYSTFPPVLVWGTAANVRAFPGRWYQSLRAEALIITPYIVNYAVTLALTFPIVS